MKLSVPDAAARLEARGLLRREKHDHSAREIDYVRERLGRPLPADLEAFYRERIAWVGSFPALGPVWNDWVGWRPLSVEVTELAHLNAVPLFLDGCGNIFGLDLPSDDSTPAVYFFDCEVGISGPEYAVGSSLGAFLLLLAEKDAAFHEGRPSGWELAIDPDLDKCARAPPIWLAD